jgi:hypothetical protein
MPWSSRALASGAVSSSWMSKRLMSVFTVIVLALLIVSQSRVTAV